MAKIESRVYSPIIRTDARASQKGMEKKIMRYLFVLRNIFFYTLLIGLPLRGGAEFFRKPDNKRNIELFFWCNINWQAMKVIAALTQ